MEIILMRHYKVNCQFKKAYDSKGFDQVCALYNESAVIDQVEPSLPPYKVYASTMLRAQQTAAHAFNDNYEVLEGIQEITMRSYKDTSQVLPLWWWEFMGRLQWRFNSIRPYENHKETVNRLEEAIINIIEARKSAILVMHGMAMRYTAPILKKHGFKGPVIIHAKNGQFFRYKSSND